MVWEGCMYVWPAADGLWVHSASFDLADPSSQVLVNTCKGMKAWG